MRTVICIVAHRGEQAIFDRHFRLWERHNGWNLVVLTPKDAPIKAEKRNLLTFPSEDGGKNHVRRWRQILSLLSTMEDVDRFVLFEPDSFCLSRFIPEFYVIGPDRVKRFDVPILVGNIRNGLSSHVMVAATHYVLHPVILTRSAIMRLYDDWRAIPDDFEGGHSDRALFRLSEQSGIRIADFHRYGLGYGQIRVFPSEYIAMQEAIQRGATMIHGIKEPEELIMARIATDPKLHVAKELPVVDDMTACWIPGPFYGYLLKDLDSKFREWFSTSGNLQDQYPELAIGLRQL